VWGSRFFKDPIPDPTLEPFDRGIATLRLDEQVVGHLASILTDFVTPFSRQKQHWVWYIVIWADGTREASEEDYPPWTVVREIQDGYFEGPGDVRYDAEWLGEPARTQMWEAFRLTPSDF